MNCIDTMHRVRGKNDGLINNYEESKTPLFIMQEGR